MDVSLEGARDLRGLILSAGRAMSGAGVDQLRASILALSTAPDRGLQEVGRYWSAAMGAALQLVREEGVDPRPLAAAVYRYYVLGLDAWFAAQAKSIASAGAPAASPISTRFPARLAAGRTKEDGKLLESLGAFCRAGTRATRGDADAQLEMTTAAEEIRAFIAGEGVAQ